MKKLIVLIAALGFTSIAQAATAGEVVIKRTGGWEAFCAVESLEEVSMDAAFPTDVNGMPTLEITCINTVERGLQEKWAEEVREHLGFME